MNWSLFRWVWQLEGPLYVGMPPAGSLNRTRLYVPARALWGALTAELSRRETLNGKEPQYYSVGESLQKDYRFTYLFPAEKFETTWRAWLPIYCDALGLAWAREDRAEDAVGDRQFRRRLLSTRPGTSIDASTDAADDGSLRETECMQACWRDRDQSAGRVAMVGYVLIRMGKEKAKYSPKKRRLDGLDTLFVGGDTRYGLGRLDRVAFEGATSARVFGSPVAVSSSGSPQIVGGTAWAHASTAAPLTGALELLGGWDRDTVRSVEAGLPLWQPGSRAAEAVSWTIGSDGVWSPALEQRD